MKIVNIMNFVRYIDERHENSIEEQYNTTRDELALVNEFGYENTFLLQYDALCSEDYQRLFREEATDKTEIGLWYEIVRPLTDACGMEYRSECGWSWDWHIVPGFSMAYTPREREILVDEAMRKFREVFGYYPKTFASWLIDTHTINYLADHYDIRAFAICRDQVSTDAYTLIGGYFNQAYYPSRKNMFTPASSDAYRVWVPMFRLLGPCPIHNLESKKYLSEEQKPIHQCFTLEPVYGPGSRPHAVDWFFRTYFENEDLGFSYAQLGQENSFGCVCDVLTPLRMQLEKIGQYPDVKIMKMSDTGDWFVRTYPNGTPATAVVATDNWDTEDAAAVVYDSACYTAHLLRYEDALILRGLYLFDERVEEAYLEKTCTTFDAVYENLPIINNLMWHPDNKKAAGLILDSAATPFVAEKVGDGVLAVRWSGGSITFCEDAIVIRAARELTLSLGKPDVVVEVDREGIYYLHHGVRYALFIEGGYAQRESDGTIRLIREEEQLVLLPTCAD